MRRTIALVGAGVALGLVMLAVSVGPGGDEANADVRCLGGSHWHQHWPAHRDYWHDHGTFTRDGRTYRRYHIHSHDSYRESRCT